MKRQIKFAAGPKWYATANDFVAATLISIADFEGPADIVLTGMGTVKGTLSGGADLSCVTVNLYDSDATDFTTPLGTQDGDNGNTYSFPGLITTPEYTLKFVSDGRRATAWGWPVSGMATSRCLAPIPVPSAMSPTHSQSAPAPQ